MGWCEIHVILLKTVLDQLISCRGLSIALGLVGYIHHEGKLRLFIIEFILKFRSLIIITLIFVWWRDVIRERWLKKHTVRIRKGLRMGVALFIVSEAFLFFSFFWAYFTSVLSPTIETGCC